MGLSNLSEHLHTEECNKLVAEYMKCMKEHRVGRFFNKCGPHEKAIRACFANEKKEKIKKKNFVTVQRWDT